MYTALIILHVILCIILIVTILLQTGRGGGLTEMFGGDTAQSVLGTQAPVLLKKITTVSAIGFIVTSLVLGMVTARRGRSLFESPIIPHAMDAEDTAFPFEDFQQEETKTFPDRGNDVPLDGQVSETSLGAQGEDAFDGYPEEVSLPGEETVS